MFEMLPRPLLLRKARWRHKISREGTHVHSHAYLRRRIEPALFPSAKRELSLTWAGEAPKSGCVDQEEPSKDMKDMITEDPFNLLTENLCPEGLFVMRTIMNGR